MLMIIESMVLIYFTYVVGYTLFFSLCSYFYTIPRRKAKFQYYKFCVFIPAYKEDAVILETVFRTIDQAYPSEYLHVVVIADGLKQKTLSALASLPIQVVPVSFEQSTKVKSLQVALNEITENFDYGVILDADNILQKDFLYKVNDLLHVKKLKAVQCQRKAKNKENSLAFLDGLSEAINNRIYRQGASAINLSSSISGSGIVIEYGLLRQNILSMDSVGGFDRELELRLIKNKAKVFYYKDAFVLDEKVSNSKSFQNQRRRWISSQYFYLRKYFKEGMISLFMGKLAFFNSSILRNVQLPRLINLGILILLTIVLFPFQRQLNFDYRVWPALLACNILVIILAIPRKYYTWSLVKSILHVPVIFIRMIFLLFKLKGANKNFIHTPHSVKHAHESR